MLLEGIALRRSTHKGGRAVTREDYRKKAELPAGLLVLSIKESDFGRAETYLTEIEQAIQDMRKQP